MGEVGDGHGMDGDGRGRCRVEMEIVMREMEMDVISYLARTISSVDPYIGWHAFETWKG